MARSKNVFFLILSVFLIFISCSNEIPLESTKFALSLADLTIGEVTIEDLESGIVRFSLRVPKKMSKVNLYCRKNGLEDYVVTDLQKTGQIRNRDKTYTYTHTRTEAYSAGDIIEARFYTYSPKSGEIFYPGPTDATWSTPLVYGSSSSSSSSVSSSSSSSTPTVGTFGVYSETVPLDVEYDVDAEIISLQGLWSCEIYTNDTVDPGEGSSCIKVVGTNLGVGFYIRRRPLGSTIDFTDIDYIHFMYKGNNGFKVAVVDQFVRSIDMDVLPGYGLVTNGTWCNIKIPLSAFTGLDVSKIESYFYIEATPVHGHSPGDIFYIDNIYFSGTNYSGNTNTPLSNSPEEFGLYSETIALDIEWNFDTKLTVFSGGMLNAKITVNPAEGSECWQFEGTDTWMGFAFEVMPFEAASAKDLSAYNYLNFNYRGTKTFLLGMRSVSAEKYLDVAVMAGYGLEFSGNWCTVRIPLSSFTGVDKSEILQYIMFAANAGTGYSVGDIHTFDHIYFSVN